MPKQRDSLILSTRNQGKVREFTDLLKPFQVKVYGLDVFSSFPELEETGLSFEENALLKARAVSRETGFVALADDSGLEVDQLQGEPGVFSARYSQTSTHAASDSSNIALVLQRLHGTPLALRGCAFHCCMAAVSPFGQELLARGIWRGRIAEKAMGSNGFGYDPIFIDPKSGLTAAQMSAEEKNAKSHRAQAVLNILKEWPGFWANYLAMFDAR